MYMDKHHDSSRLLEQEPTIANAPWDTEAYATRSAVDPSYDRDTEALRRWVDGMEAALNKRRR